MIITSTTEIVRSAQTSKSPMTVEPTTSTMGFPIGFMKVKLQIGQNNIDDHMLLFTEEMISSNNVMYFSPEGSHLAFAQFNDTECDHIEFSRFDGEKYPKMVDVSYPKVSRRYFLLRAFFFFKMQIYFCNTEYNSFTGWHNAANKQSVRVQR